MKFSSLNYGQQYNSRSRMMELLLLQILEPTTTLSSVFLATWNCIASRSLWSPHQGEECSTAQ